MALSNFKHAYVFSVPFYANKALEMFRTEPLKQHYVVFST